MSICDLNTTMADCKRAKSFSHCGLVNEKICGCSVRPELDDGTVGSGVATVQNFESGTCHLNCGRKKTRTVKTSFKDCEMNELILTLIGSTVNVCYLYILV